MDLVFMCFILRLNQKRKSKYWSQLCFRENIWPEIIEYQTIYSKNSTQKPVQSNKEEVETIYLLIIRIMVPF